MPTTPQITLTATLDDLVGNAAGSVANPAKLRIALCPSQFGGALPRIVGTANVAKPGPYFFYDNGSGISITLWGNDQIAPLGTFYEIAVLDGQDNVVQCAAYIFTGTTTVDLSAAIPMTAGMLVGAVPNGNLPGADFSVPVPVFAGGTEAMFYYGGLLQDPDLYTLAGMRLGLGWQAQPGDSLYTQYVTASYGVGLPLLPWLAVANGVFPGTAYTLPTAPPGAQLAGIFLDGAFQRPGTDYNISGLNLTTTFVTPAPNPSANYYPSLKALYLIGATGALTAEPPSGSFPGTVYTLSLTPKVGVLVGLYYNSLFQRPGIDYTLAGTTVTLNFATQSGDNVYAVYLA